MGISTRNLMCFLPASAGPGASNVISDSVSMSGTLRALTKKHFEHMRIRVTEVGSPSIELLICASSERSFMTSEPKHSSLCSLWHALIQASRVLQTTRYKMTHPCKYYS